MVRFRWEHGMTAIAALWLAGAAHAAPSGDAGRCGSALKDAVAAVSPGFRLIGIDHRDAGLIVANGQAVSPPLPAHCDISGIMHERRGVDGQDYAIRFHLRLPDAWNGGFLFQGGGGSNGEIGNAIGPIGHGSAPALVRGYAVVSQDSGHSNATNSRPGQGGQIAFGQDPQARLDYGYASLKPVYDAAQTIIGRYYGAAPQHRYFAGCSKGGQEGVQFAERYPKAFDGILACAPGISLARAAFATAGQTQAFARIAAAPTLLGLAHAFTDDQLAVAQAAILAACDKDDGLADGQVNNFTACTSAKVLPQLRARQCTPGSTKPCLSAAQIVALRLSFEGPRDGHGKPVYASFPWDSGVADKGWRVWRLGLAGADGTVVVPPVDVTLVGPAMATLYATPPKVLPDDPQAQMTYQLGIRYDRDLPAIFATDATFRQSAWDMTQARTTDLSGFNAAHGKLMIVQGVSDPIFSIEDSIAWLREVAQRAGGDASSFLRLFAVPGMVHCEGGLATDQFDAFAVLVDWVEKNRAPERIEARADPQSPWKDRARPLCAFPAYARYRGGDVNDAASFACALPASKRS